MYLYPFVVFCIKVNEWITGSVILLFLIYFTYIIISIHVFCYLALVYGLLNDHKAGSSSSANCLAGAVGGTAAAERSACVVGFPAPLAE